MQKCESRTKRVMSAIIAGMMALQVVAPTISYADDTVASTASSEDNSKWYLTIMYSQKTDRHCTKCMTTYCFVCASLLLQPTRVALD